MLLTRTEHIILMIATTLTCIFGVLGFLDVPSGAPLAQRVEGIVRPLALLGCLSGILISSHMLQWGIELMRRGLTRRHGGVG
jgi:hypothetical protein